MALGEQVLSAARPHKRRLSKGVARVLGALAARHKELTEVLRDQVVQAEGSAAEKVASDRRLDGCWSGFNDFLCGLAKLPPEVPQAVEAAELQAAIFPGGLGFLTKPYPVEWSESEIRLQRIRKNGFDARVKALGGQIFLDAIASAHAAYGEAIGVTTALAAKAPAPAGSRDARERFADALRDYVIKVLGSVEPDEPETEELADALLAPLAAWDVGPTTRAGSKPAPEEAETPAAPEAAPAAEAEA
jgi:hypothetical protein